MKTYLVIAVSLVCAATLCQSSSSLDKQELLEEEIMHKIAAMIQDKHPDEINVLMTELKDVLTYKMPQDPELRHKALQDILDAIDNQELDEDDLPKGFRNDPFNPFEKVPFPK